MSTCLHENGAASFIAVRQIHRPERVRLECHGNRQRCGQPRCELRMDVPLPYIRKTTDFDRRLRRRVGMLIAVLCADEDCTRREYASVDRTSARRGGHSVLRRRCAREWTSSLRPHTRRSELHRHKQMLLRRELKSAATCAVQAEARLPSTVYSSVLRQLDVDCSFPLTATSAGVRRSTQ